MALSATCLWASVNDLKPWLGLSAQMDVAHDAMLEARANAVTEEIERETGRIFVTRSFTEVLDGTGTSELCLRGYPAVVVSAFTLNGTAVAATDYTLDADAGILKHETGVWTKGTGNYSITYTAGYARASVPASVVLLGVELLRARYLTWSNNADVFSYQAQAGGGTVQPMSDWVSIRKQIDALKHEIRVRVGT